VGTGSQDLAQANLLTLLASGCHRIKSVRGTLSGNSDAFGPRVLWKYHVGETREEFERAIKNDDYRGLPNLPLSTEAAIADLGLTIKSTSKSAQPIILDRDIIGKVSGTKFLKNTVVGIVITAIIETEQGITFNLVDSVKVREKPEKDEDIWFTNGSLKPNPTTSMAR